MRWSVEELFYGIKIASGSGMSFGWRLKHFFQSAWRIIKVICKWIFTGYCWSTLWNLDNYLMTVIIKRLKLFRKMKRYGYPAQLNSEDEWEKIIDHMISGFEIMQNESISLGVYESFGDKQPSTIQEDGRLVSNYTEEEHAKIVEAQIKQNESDEETIQLFIKYFRDLWD